jgi:hypothetical protein
METIKFWKDNWLDQSLHTLYPEVYERSNQRNSTIHQIFNHEEWCLILYETQRQIENINKRFQEVTLMEQVQDEVIWIRGNSGFTVKSQYKFLLEGARISSSFHLIWKIKAPPRTSFFT